MNKACYIAFLLFCIHVQRKLTNLCPMWCFHFYMLLFLSQVAFNITNIGKPSPQIHQAPGPADYTDQANHVKDQVPAIMNSLVVWSECKRSLQNCSGLTILHQVNLLILHQELNLLMPKKYKVCPESIQPCKMENQHLCWRRYKKHCAGTMMPQSPSE